MKFRFHLRLTAAALLAVLTLPGAVTAQNPARTDTLGDGTLVFSYEEPGTREFSVEEQIEMVIRQQLAGGSGRTLPYVILGALALGCQMLAGHPEITYYTGLVTCSRPTTA